MFVSGARCCDWLLRLRGSSRRSYRAMTDGARPEARQGNGHRTNSRLVADVVDMGWDERRLEGGPRFKWPADQGRLAGRPLSVCLSRCYILRWNTEHTTE